MGWLRSWRRKLRQVSFPREWLAYALLVLGVAMIGCSAWYALDARYREADATASRLAAAMAQDVDRGLQQIDLTLQALAARHLSADELDAQARNAQLFERVKRDVYVDLVDVLDAKGGFVAGLPPQQPGSSWAARDYFLEQRNASVATPFVGRPYLTSSEERASIPISRRMTDAEGNFAGVVVIGLRLAYFRELFRNLDLRPGESVTLLRNDGVILLRLPFDLNDVGRTLPADAPFYRFVHGGASSAVAAAPIDRPQGRLALQPVGRTSLVISVGVPSGPFWDSASLWWFAALSVVLLSSSALMASGERRERRGRQIAEQESREKSQFLTTLSHQLRTPLHAALGHAEQLAHEPQPTPARSQQVAGIVTACKHMRDVVNAVLDYARIEALGPVLHMHLVDIRGLIERCVGLVAPAARGRGLELRNTAAAGAPERFVTDEVQFGQILVNLLSNAVKYTPGGSVEVRLSGDEERLRLEVVDTGIGIPENQRHRLFKEFVRFGTERTGIEGTGLGLAIASRLVRRMGGHIGHRPNPGGGSIFWLELPAGVPDEPEVEHPVAAPERGLRVLVTDDTEVNRKVTCAYLRRAGHEAVEAGSGGQAVQLAGTQDFDAVLMDVRMPEVDGLEATRRIRAIPGRRGRVPIVAVTANALDQQAEACRRAGMCEHLAKPFTQAELNRVIARAAARSPRGPVPAQHRIDTECLAQVASIMGEQATENLLDRLALRIESLLRELDDNAEPEKVVALAHEIAGSSGTLGFVALASAARGFETAAEAGHADGGELRCEAAAALDGLRHRRSLETLLPV
jgi:signal transduction histidine kinase/DNA-binding response OmpR family regulator